MLIPPSLGLANHQAALDRFRYNFRTSHDVVFPAPVHPLTNEFVLVEDYIDGVPISTVLKVGSQLYTS